jgi:hypothetical protein
LGTAPVGQISCDCGAEAQDPEDKLNTRRYTPRDLFDGVGLMAAPFVVTEFSTHDPKLRFCSLNHLLGSATNAQWPVAVLPIFQNLLQLAAA